MNAAQEAREKEKKELLARLAEIEIEELREEGVFLDTPHYGTLERAASALGRELSRETQQRAAREVRAECPAEAVCPACGATCRVESKSRSVTSMDGPVTLDEAAAHCKTCRRSFFPSTCRTGS